MPDIFSEVSNELRRDRMQNAWAAYRLPILAVPVVLVLGVALNVTYDYWQRSQNEETAARYTTLIEELSEDVSAKNKQLSAFAEAQGGGYGALARFAIAIEKAQAHDGSNALASFDALAAQNDLPEALRAFARIQAAIVLVDTNNAPQEVEARLGDLLENDTGFRPMARDIMALSWMLAGEPLQARALYQLQLADAKATRLSKERATIMLSKVQSDLSSTTISKP